MYTNDQVEHAKHSLSITQYLASKGIQPIKTSGGQYLYFSPFRDEKTPSFWVEPASNVFNDFGEDYGDLIRLVMKLEKLNFVGAMKFIINFSGTYDIEIQAPNLPSNPQYQHKIINITAVTDYRLLNYAKSRGIDSKTLNNFCRQIRYSSPKGDFTSIGFKNEGAGWELRNERFKGCLGEKNITLLGDLNSTTINIFEGFIDFLSYVVLFGYSPKQAFLVLNSLSLVNRILEPLNKFSYINLYLDNDASGRKATEQVLDKYPNACDWDIGLYPVPLKDLNDKLMYKIRNGR